MKLSQHLLAAAALSLSLGANAQVAGSLGGAGTFLTLSSAGLSGGSVATLSGGTVYTADQPFADIPAGAVFGGSFLAAGVTAGVSSTLTFSGGGVPYISFLWGSPDTYNILTVGTSAGTQTFTTTSLGFLVSNGNQGFSQPVQFSASAGSSIRSLTFTNEPGRNAFEVANFSLTPVSVVPEPETYALLLAGLCAVIYIARRRNLD